MTFNIGGTANNGKLVITISHTSPTSFYHPSSYNSLTTKGNEDYNKIQQIEKKMKTKDKQKKSAFSACL